MKIAMIGTGYVVLVSGVCFSDFGHDGICVDKNPDKIAQLQAGKVPIFTAPGTHAALVAGCARHVEPGGLLIAGFQLGRGFELSDYDAYAAAAGLALRERFATWDGAPFPGDGTYAVSVHEHT